MYVPQKGFCVLGTILGGLGFLVGAALLIDGASKLSIYKKQHSSLSLGLKCSPKMTGVSLVYRF